MAEKGQNRKPPKSTAAFRFAPKADATKSLLEGVEKRFCGLEIGRVEALSEPVVDRLKV